jgi:S-adenosylmethionine uptake transporter
MHSNLKGALFALAGFALFSVADALVKNLGAAYSPVQIVGFVCLLTLPLIALLWLRSPVSLRPVHPWLMGLRTLAMIGNGLLITFSFTVLPLAQVYAIAFTMPLLITLLAWPVLGDKITFAGATAILMGLVGVIVALQPGQVTPSIGHLAVVGGVALGAVHYIIIRLTGGVEAAVPMLLYPVSAQAIVTLLLLPSRYVPMPAADLALVAGIALAAFAATLLMIAAYRVAPPIVVAPAQYSQIVWAAVLGTFFFGEAMAFHTVLGMVLIAIAGLIVVARPQPAVVETQNET